MMEDALAFAQFKTQWIKDLIPILNMPGTTILDVGSGDGLMTYYVQEIFFQARVIGVDQESVIQRICKEFPELHFLTFKKHNFDLDTKESFDAIIISQVLHHLTLEQQTDMLNTLDRYLKSAGWIIILDFNRYSFMHVGRSIKKVCSDAQDWTSLTQLKNILHEYQFIKSRYACFFPSWASFLVGIEQYIQRIPLGSLAMHLWKKG